MESLRLFDFQATPVKGDVKQILGALLAADWRQALIARGFGWHGDVGAFSTPIVGGGNGTIIDLDQPEFGLSVPDGYTLVPLRFAVDALPGVQTADDQESEILIAVDKTAKWAGDGTVTTEAPTNMRLDLDTACPITMFSAATADITDPVLGVELARAIKTENFGDATGMELQELRLLYEPRHAPLLVGPCAVYGYWGGAVAVSGFANLDFLAVPSTLFTGLV